MSQRTVRLVTLGCKVNQYETQYVKEALLSDGYREASDAEAADLCVVNTCTVTSEGDSKSRQTIRRLVRDNPGTRVLVMGCYATRDPRAVRRLPGVMDVVTDKRSLPETLGRLGVRRLPRGISRFDGHQRAFVKVQDGCILDCTFCIIPTVRPGLQSRTPEDILDEIRRLVDNGYREIVLTGIHLGHYGIDLSQARPRAQWFRLWHLLERIEQLPGEFRVRLSSLEASEVTDDFLAALGACRRVCPHLHLSLQSGSDAVLARMRRRYRMASFLARVEAIRRRLEQPAFTTDVIVGFPGETEADFAATLRAVETVGFSKIHIFPFSPRAGAAAAEFASSVPPAVKLERKSRLTELERRLTFEYYQSLLGRTLEVLVERPVGPAPLGQPTWMRGTSCRSAPIRFQADPASAWRLVPIRATAVHGGMLIGEPDSARAREREGD